MKVDDIKLAGEKQNINPTWKILVKDVDLGEPRVALRERERMSDKQ